MQLVNNTDFQVMPGYMNEVKLPSLPDADIKKLDQLLSFMKKNKTESVNIYMFCKAKWGDNRLLYLYFAEYLRKNSFACIQYQNQGAEYVWQQIITPTGLAFDGFKREHVRQYESEKAKKETSGHSWYTLRGLASVVLINIIFLRLRWFA